MLGFCLLWLCYVPAQSIKGKVYELNEANDTVGSVACVVYDVVSGRSVMSDENGII